MSRLWRAWLPTASVGRRCLSFAPRVSESEINLNTPGRMPPDPVKKLRVLHQDENYCIVDKQADFRMCGDFPNTLEQLIHATYPNLNFPTCGHNLDYATSGVMVWAFNRDAARQAHFAFQQREVKKHYIAMVHGHVHGDCVRVDDADELTSLPSPLLTVEAALEPDPTHAFKMRVASQRDGGKEAATRLWVMRRGSFFGRPASLLLLQPITGRRHQLRVHLAHVGYPIIGDATYAADYTAPRMMLHAWSLRFTGEQEPSASLGAIRADHQRSSRRSGRVSKRRFRAQRGLLGLALERSHFVAQDPIGEMLEPLGSEEPLAAEDSVGRGT